MGAGTGAGVPPVIAGATPARNRPPFACSDDVFHTNAPRKGATPFHALTAVGAHIMSTVVSSAAAISSPRTSAFLFPPTAGSQMLLIRSATLLIICAVD